MQISGFRILASVCADDVRDVLHVSSSDVPDAKVLKGAKRAEVTLELNTQIDDAGLNALTEGIYDLFDPNTVDGVTGNFRFNWTNDESILSVKVGSFGIYTNYINGLGLWSAGKPNTISVFINRIGYVTMTNGVISIQPDTTSANNKTQVQLQKFDDGFLKNEIVPMDKLAQKNRFQPLK